MANSSVELQIIKQVEYYFSDLNITRDRFMKQAISQNDGWISWDTLLKFNRLRNLSDDKAVIEDALNKCASGLLEVGPEGVRRNPNLEVPDNFDEVYAGYKDSTVYVKGINTEATLDEIIEWLETHGGKTLNVHMRRLLKDRQFKGSIFAVFEMKEDAEKFLKSEDTVKYKGSDTIRMYREDYLKSKEQEKNAKLEAKMQKAAADEAIRNEQVSSRMVPGTLLELSGLPEVDKNRTTSAKESINGNVQTSNVEENVSEGNEIASTEDSKKNAELTQVTSEPPSDIPDSSGTAVENVETPKTTTTDAPNDSNQTENSNALRKHSTLSVVALKQWLVDKVGTTVAWIDISPSTGIAIVRFKTANSAQEAWDKLKASAPDGRVLYAGCELTGRVMSGAEEINHWKDVLDSQKSKNIKRRQKQGGRGGHNKRRRMF